MVSSLFAAAVRSPTGKHADLPGSQDVSAAADPQLLRSPLPLCPEEREASVQSWRSDQGEARFECRVRSKLIRQQKDRPTVINA